MEKKEGKASLEKKGSYNQLMSQMCMLLLTDRGLYVQLKDAAETRKDNLKQHVKQCHPAVCDEEERQEHYKCGVSNHFTVPLS